MTVWSSYLAGALAWFIATGAGVGSMQGGDPARAPKDERLRTLSALASHRLEATSAQIADCLRSALTDPDAEIRVQGLAVIAGRAGRVRFDIETVTGTLPTTKLVLPGLIVKIVSGTPT